LIRYVCKPCRRVNDGEPVCPGCGELREQHSKRCACGDCREAAKLAARASIKAKANGEQVKMGG
jgi:hypothetical protein